MLMAVLMIASLVPATALAADTTADDEYVINQKADAEKKLPGITVKENKNGTYTVKITPFITKTKDQCKTHTIVSDKLITADCNHKGLTVFYCSGCGKQMMNSIEAEKLDHDYKFTVVVEPTCKTAGWGYAVCSLCGDVESVDSSAEAMKLLPADAKQSLKDDAAAMFEAAGHSKDLVKVEKDVYEEDGKTVKAYAPVEASHYETINGSWVALDKDYAIVAYYAEHIVDGKQVNKDVNPEFAYKSYEVAKGIAGDDVCPVCGDVITENRTPINNLNETHKQYMKVITKGEKPYIDDDGDKIDGTTDYVYCSKCDDYFGGTVLTYDEFYRPEKTADPAIGTVMTFDGKETVFAVSNGTLVDVTNSLKLAANATCQAAGYTGDVIVYTASGTADKDTGKVPGVWMLKETGKELKQLDHHYVACESKDATCTEDGVKYVGVSQCDNVVGVDKTTGKDILCGEYKLAKINNAKLDAYGEVDPAGFVVPKAHGDKAEKVLVEATCKNEGLNALVCSVCGEYLLDGADHSYKTDKVACVAADKRVDVVEATCTEKGYTGDEVCKWCGTVLAKGEETEALGHNFEKGVCTVCGEADPDYVANPFTDVSSDSKFYDAILWAVEEGVTEGTTKTTFSPNKGCTRAEIVTFLYRAAGSPEVGADVVNPFTDVSKDSKFYNAILWAVEKGITKGTTDTTFSPSKVCTRGEIVTFLFRASGDEKVATSVAFTDVAAGSYCYDAVAWAVANGVTTGKTATTFAPADTCTRGEAVTFIYRANAE